MLLPVADCPRPPPLAAPRVDRPRYSLAVRVDPGFRRVRGSVRVTFTASRPTDRLVFRLWPNGPLEREQGSRLDAGPVRAGDGALPVRRPDPTTLVVRLRDVLDDGESITVRMPWTLRVPFEVTDRNSRFPGGLRLGSFFPILAWDPERGWATDPPPLVPAESATSPTADFDIRIRTPHGTRAAVSGTRIGNGHWRADGFRDVGLAVARFRFLTTTAHVPAPVNVRVAIAPGSAAVGPRMLATAKAALERLSRMYGAYPWREFTLVFPPDAGRFGIEYPGLVFVGNRLTTVIIRHETAHQWFYALVGNDQARDPWLDEGLATWAEGRLSGSDARGLNIRPRRVGAPMTYWGRRGRAYYTEVYGGAVVALHSLGSGRRVDCALRLYVARNAYRIARPGDLLDALNEVLPGAERRLRRFGIHR